LLTASPKASLQAAALSLTVTVSDSVTLPGHVQLRLLNHVAGLAASGTANNLAALWASLGLLKQFCLCARTLNH
jgi:hypothetical protein